MTRRARDRTAGFTLVELLIALTLLGLLTTLIFGGLRLAARAWAKVDDRAAEAADQWAVEDVLRHAVTAAYPAFASADPGDRTIVFDGTDKTLALLAPLPQAIGSGITAQMRFFLADQEHSRTLVMGWRLDLPSAATGASLPENQVKLLDHVRSIQFEYFGPAAEGGAPIWQAQWSGRDRLPDLVRIHLERDGPASSDWPDLLVEPRAAMNSACLYDAATLGCRRIR
jgi:general secretion pathway protein J